MHSSKTPYFFLVVSVLTDTVERPFFFVQRCNAYVRTNYRCFHCEKNFKDSLSLGLHLGVIFGANAYTFCPVCGLDNKLMAENIAHVKDAHMLSLTGDML